MRRETALVLVAPLQGQQVPLGSGRTSGLREAQHGLKTHTAPQDPAQVRALGGRDTYCLRRSSFKQELEVPHMT